MLGFPTLFSSFFLRFEIYDDARTRALASSDYVTIRLKGVRLVEESVLAHFFIYKIPTEPYRTLTSDSALVLLAGASCFVVYIFPRIAEVGFVGWRIRGQSC